MVNLSTQENSGVTRGGGRGATAPFGRNSAPLLPPNEITLCTDVYGERPFWVLVSPPCSPLSPPCHPSFWKSGYAPAGESKIVGEPTSCTTCSRVSSNCSKMILLKGMHQTQRWFFWNICHDTHLWSISDYEQNKIFQTIFNVVSSPVAMATAAILDFIGYFCAQLLSTFPNLIFSEILYMGNNL